MSIVTDTASDGQVAPSAPSIAGHHLPQPSAAPVGDAAASVELADRIIQLVRTWSYLKAKLVSTGDTEVSSLFLIGRLVKDGPTRAKDLAGAICADQSTVSRQVAALVKAGLVERQADPDDGRASILVPTALGIARLEKHFANRGRALEPLVADWSADERQQFVELMRRFTTSLESRRDEVARTMAHGHAEALSQWPGAHAGSTERAPFDGRAQSDPADVPPSASFERSN